MMNIPTRVIPVSHICGGAA
jgi:hypothetical protein